MGRALALLSMATLAIGLAACDGKGSKSDVAGKYDISLDANGQVIPEDELALMESSEFVDFVASGIAYDMAAAKLAQRNAKAGPVKDFAKEILIAHAGSLARLKAAAAKANPPIKVDSSLAVNQSMDLTTLKDLYGADFNQSYARDQMAAQQDMLSTLKRYSAAGNDPLLKKFSEEHIPIVAAQLDAANKLQPWPISSMRTGN